MSRSTDPAKREQWTRRFQRFSQAGITVAQFCQRERVSVANFYQWRKKLAADGDQILPTTIEHSFVPVRLTRVESVEVRLRNGVVVSLPAGDHETLRQALLVVSQLPTSPSSQEPRRC